MKINYILIAICIVLASMLFAKCENEKVLSSSLDTLNIEMKSYKLKDGKIVNTTKVITYEKVPAKTELTKQFAKVTANTKIVTQFVIDTVVVYYKDTIPCNYIKEGSINKKYYSLNYKSNQKGITLSDLKVPDTLDIVVGYKKEWLFGKTTHVIDVKHSNPYVKTNGITHFEIQPKKKFYQTTIFKIGIGILAGAIITK